MKKVLVCLVLASMTITATAQKTPVMTKVTTKPKITAIDTPKIVAKPKNPGIKNSMDSLAYAIGVNIGGSLESQELSKLNLTLIQKGMSDVIAKKTPYVSPDMCNMLIQSYMQGLQQKSQASSLAKVDLEKGKGANFLKANKLRPGVIETASGLQYEVVTHAPEGTNAPALADTVVVHYIVGLLDGTEIENSNKTGQPLVIAVTGVIPGWTEVLQLMHVGDKFKVWVPSSIGYGDRGGGPIPGGATLAFTMELMGIKPAASK